MRKILLSFILLMSVMSLSAQINWGAKAGLNLSMAGYGSKTAMKLSVNGGILAEIDIDAKFSIQPELLYSRQGYVDKFAGAVGQLSTDDIVRSEKYCLDYINLPILVKYYLTPDLSVDFGPQLGYCIYVTKTIDDGYREEDPENVTDSYKMFDFSLCAGVTYNFSDLVAVSARYNVGLIELDKTDEGRLHNNVVQVNLEFTF